MKSLARRINEKLVPKFFGPYKIFGKVGPVAYYLELLDYSSIYLVFHVSQLKKTLGLTCQPQNILQELIGALEWKVQPKVVLTACR